MAKTDFGKRLEETAATLRKVGEGLQQAIEADGAAPARGDDGDMPRNLSGGISYLKGGVDAYLASQDETLSAPRLGWIAVTERLPSKFGHHPIIHSHKSFSGHLIRQQYYASYDPEDGLWHDLHVWDDTRWSKVVTHWFELPELSSQ